MDAIVLWATGRRDWLTKRLAILKKGHMSVNEVRDGKIVDVTLEEIAETEEHLAKVIEIIAKHGSKDA